jgi:hypothetical protein
MTYTGAGNILICWEHDALTDIVNGLGDNHAPKYKDNEYENLRKTFWKTTTDDAPALT